MIGIPALDCAFETAGAAAWGGVSLGALLDRMSGEDCARAEALCPGACSVLAAAFPYFAGIRPGNLSLYARGEDYHRAVTRRLGCVCEALTAQFPENRFVAGADSSPIPEKPAAWLAGLGLRGRHSLLILPPYGSYVFLGTILTDCSIPFPSVSPAPDCMGCGQCAAACPTGALNGGGVNCSRCLSHITQKKGELSDWERAAVARHPYAWGCDICQRACPHNRAAHETALPEFREALLDALVPELLEGLTNRAFRDRYGGRAFSWRGPAVLRRNLALQNGTTV